MATNRHHSHPITSVLLLLQLLLLLLVQCDLQSNYYNESCPRAEDIIKEQVTNLYNLRGNTAVSWIRNIFHDCIVQSCDASLLLDTKNGIVSEKTSSRSFGMRNFKYIDTIKDALERECPLTVSCADIVALSARDGVVMLGGPQVEMKTGRRDSMESYVAVLEDFIPNHDDNVSVVLSRFDSSGVDVEGTIALLGAHSVGRVHCMNLVVRLYPDLDPTMDPVYGEHLRRRCPTPAPDPKALEYARNDPETPMVLDNMYFKNLLSHKGLLLVDQQLVSDLRTAPFVEKMASDNDYFHQQFSRALLLLSENNPLTGDQGEVRKDCRYVNSKMAIRDGGDPSPPIPAHTPAEDKLTSPGEDEPTVSGPSPAPAEDEPNVSGPIPAWAESAPIIPGPSPTPAEDEASVSAPSPDI